MPAPWRPHRIRMRPWWSMPAWPRLAALLLVLGLVLGLAAPDAGAQAQRWRKLAEDGVHDPRSPAIGVLQEPGEALRALPPDSAGNKVNWVKAIEIGAINPRTNIRPETEVRLREDDLIVARNGSMPAVKFPHRQHTLWLDCSNCHDKPFKPQLGANRLSMSAILDGEQCGLCHGAVSFPLTECNRCHSVPNNLLPRQVQR